MTGSSCLCLYAGELAAAASSQPRASPKVSSQQLLAQDKQAVFETPFHCPFKMESFAVAHSGSLNHIHTLAFSPSAVDIAREARIIVTVVVAGWITVTVARGLLSNFGNRRH